VWTVLFDAAAGFARSYFNWYDLGRALEGGLLSDIWGSLFTHKKMVLMQL